MSHKRVPKRESAGNRYALRFRADEAGFSLAANRDETALLGARPLRLAFDFPQKISV